MFIKFRFWRLCALKFQTGEYALLNTSLYKHGYFINNTNKTRLSIDFRFIPKANLKNNKSSLTKRRKIYLRFIFFKAKCNGKKLINKISKFIIFEQ